MMRLIHGSAHSIPDLADGSVSMICTSPPYWSLRRYEGEQDIEWPAVSYAPMAGLEPIHIPGCDPACVHEWTDGPVTAVGRNDGDRNDVNGFKGSTNFGDAGGRKATQGAYCLHCGGWRGALGLEPDLTAYIGHLILCLREWRRILRDDGTCWVNLGDSYNGSGGAGGDYAAGGLREGQPKYPGRKMAGLKPKDLCGVPWRFAFAAQADGWWLRSDIIGHKLAPMPESVTDRPTRAHEHIFLLAKSAKYYYDAEAVREQLSETTLADRRMNQMGATYNGAKGRQAYGEAQASNGQMESWRLNPAGRNLRDVWEWRPSPFPGAHFAVWPESIPEKCIRAGSSQRGVCPKCGAPWERVTDEPEEYKEIKARNAGWTGPDTTGNMVRQRTEGKYTGSSQAFTIGWRAGCTCDAGEPVPATVLDPFSGSSTTGRVALRLGRAYVGVDLSAEYLGEITDARFANGVQVEMAL